ncbi:MAG: ATP phosphoribosyltransferase regulatory subunit, partial [Novosphingobium sp.]
FPDALIALAAGTEHAEDCMFLPLGHDRETAARLRSIGWRTVAALGDADSAAALGCTYVLEGGEPVRL